MGSVVWGDEVVGWGTEWGRGGAGRDAHSEKVHSCVPPWGFGSRCGSSAGSPTAHAAKSEPPEAATAATAATTSDGTTSDSNAAADGIESDLSGGADAPAQDVVRGVICEPALG